MTQANKTAPSLAEIKEMLSNKIKDLATNVESREDLKEFEKDNILFELLEEVTKIKNQVEHLKNKKL